MRFYCKGARDQSVILAGFDFDDSSINMIKKKEVKWAKELIRMSEFEGEIHFFLMIKMQKIRKSSNSHSYNK
jgi:uncharacterized Rossmann fold enzyme